MRQPLLQLNGQITQQKVFTEMITLKITVLTENTCHIPGLVPEHGLSLYIETEKHKILFDTGASGIFAENAKKSGIDLSSADTAVISHGHYDHGGGIKRFLEINSRAPVYIRENAFDGIYRLTDTGMKYIGLDKSLENAPRLKKVSGNTVIDNELSLFTNITGDMLRPAGNLKMRVEKDGGFELDRFSHEQCLAVNSGGKTALFAGCSHNGAVNIFEEYKRLYGCEPDIFAGGFHFRKDGCYSDADKRVMRRTAEYFKNTKTHFYTCHCTGTEPYEIMRDIMGNQLSYLSCGDTVTI